MSAENFGYGQATPWDFSHPYNEVEFVFRQLMARNATMKIVRVEAVHAGAGALAAPTVDVLPLVNQVDGNRNATPHGVVFGLPVFRLQGGTAAVLVDPAVGDVGLAVVADRDISNAKANPGEKVTPGSLRMFDLADGVYLGGAMNAAPTSYVRLKADGTFEAVDAFGNEIVSSAVGMTLIDVSANQIQMRPGLVNVVTLSFQVNGVPVTVP